ncbi:MAG: hypothetical protein JO353_13335 [Phycisphaerae bacterium]|nr:hypothetical protein [Phycisphaerae bacterium]
MIGSNVISRQTSAALTDAAAQLLNAETENIQPAELERFKRTGSADSAPLPDFAAPTWPESVPIPKTARTARVSGASGTLDLVELALRQYSSYAPAWHLVAKLAKDQQLDDAQKHRWADLILKKCGSRHPDFAMEILDPMILSVADAQAQSNLWDTVFPIVQRRPDLAANVRMHQAAIWRKNNDLAKAGICYQDVIQHFINAGPFALPALRGAEEVLVQMNRKEHVLDLYAMAAKTVTPPEQTMASDIVHQSNWYKVREAYAHKLEEAGNSQEAAKVHQEDENPSQAAKGN